jgi:UDP-glucose 4-epimerase
LGEYYRVPPDLRDLNYEKFVELGELRISDALEYTSHNTTRLDAHSMLAMLMQLPYIQTTLHGGQVQEE